MSGRRSESPAAMAGVEKGFWGRPGSQSRSQSRSRGGNSLLSGLGLSQPSLRVDFAEEVLYLHPREGEPTYDPSIEGTVTLWLPKARTIKDLSVKLSGRVDLGWKNRPYETFTCLEKVVELVRDDKDQIFEKGEHTFAFSMIVTSSAAPYERCQYGRTRHFVIARAAGLGALGGDIVSNEKELFLIVNPGALLEGSAPPPPLHYKLEGVDDALGPWTAALQSQHVMVGGLLLFRIHLQSPPTDLAIYSMRIKIMQHCTLKSPPDREPVYIETPPSDSRTVALLDIAHPPNMGHIMASSSGTRSGTQTPRSGALAVLSPGEEYKAHHLTRLLNDNIIRASTQPGTETSINLRHDIVVEIIYSALPGTVNHKEKEKSRDPERKMFSISKPLEIYSCCCWLDSLVLPAYTEKDPNPTQPEGDVPCMCGFPIAMIIKTHGGTLLQEEGEGGITYAEPVKPDDDVSDSRGRSRRSSPTRRFTG